VLLDEMECTTARPAVQSTVGCSALAEDEGGRIIAGRVPAKVSPSLMPKV